MNATILPNGIFFEVWVDNEVVFIHSDKVEAAIWANQNGYTITN